MRFSEDSKIGEIIDYCPEAIDAIASVNSHFNKLRNPLLRKLFARRVTVKEAAAIGGCKAADLLRSLQGIGLDCVFPSSEDKISGSVKTTGIIRTATLTYDVRDDLKLNRDPLKKILELCRTLKKDDTLCIINSFEPLPLINLLRVKGYSCETEHQGEVYKVFIQPPEIQQRESKDEKEHESFSEVFSRYQNHLIHLDVSKLEMPGPMVTILSEAAKLKPANALHVVHRKFPELLIPELRQRLLEIAFRRKGETGYEFLIYRRDERASN